MEFDSYVAMIYLIEMRNDNDQINHNDIKKCSYLDGATRFLRKPGSVEERKEKFVKQGRIYVGQGLHG